MLNFFKRFFFASQSDEDRQLQPENMIKNTQKSLHKQGVVIASDSQYFRAVPTFLTSFYRYNSYPVTFLDCGITPEQQKQLCNMVEKIIPINNCIKTTGNIIKGQHLNKSALASLFIHYSGYEEILYLDIDTIVLGKLNPLLESLKDFDIVGVRGGIIRYLKEGKIYTVGDTVSLEGHPQLLKVFPEANLESIATNTGCFAVRALVLEKWQQYYSILLPLLGYYRYVDQSIINILLSTNWFKFSEMPPEYNFAGLGDALNEDGKFDVRFVIEQDEPAMYFEDRRLILAHFSGKTKPWNVKNNSPGSQAWQYFSNLDLDINNIHTH